MRFSYIVLAAAVTLLAGNNGVFAANSDQISKAAASDAVRSLAGQVVNDHRLLKKVEVEEEEDEDDEHEERAAFAGLGKLKAFVWRLKIRSWYKADMTPKQVNTMLISKGDKVDWALATAYASYWRNLKYGPFAIDMIDKEKDESSS